MRALWYPTAALLGIAFAIACERDRSVRYPPPQPPAFSAPAPSVAAPGPASDAPLPAPSAPPPPILFREGPPIRFKSGPPLKLKPIATDAQALALSPDAKSYVLLLHGNRVKLVTPANPAGVEFEGSAASGAMFSPDGSLVLIRRSAFAVVDVATGKERLALETESECAVRFTNDGGLVWHEEAGAWNEWLGPVKRVSLAGGAPVSIGPKRFARSCEAALDGSVFITTFPEPVTLVDARTGRSRVLVEDKQADVIVSPAADRYCVSGERDKQDLTCTRIADGGVERLFVGASYPAIQFDPIGRRALLVRSREDERGVWGERFIADFASATLRRIDGFEPKSGALPVLLPGGQLLIQGSSRGLMVYDLDRGEKRFIAKQRLFGAEPMLGHERRFFADAETFGGQDNAELFFVEWP